MAKIWRSTTRDAKVTHFVYDQHEISILLRVTIHVYPTLKSNLCKPTLRLNKYLAYFTAV